MAIAVILGACQEPNGTSPLKAAGGPLLSVTSNEPADFVALTDWPMDSLTGGDWTWGCPPQGWYVYTRECQSPGAATAIVAPDSSDPGTGPNVMRVVSDQSGRGFKDTWLFNFSGPHRREEYSAFWWKGTAPTILVMRERFHNDLCCDMRLAITLRDSQPVVTAVIDAPIGYRAIGNDRCGDYGDDHQYRSCTLYGLVAGGSTLVKLGEWHRFEWYLKTSELHDGIMRVWLDGRRAFDYTDLELPVDLVSSPYSIGHSGSFDDVRISVPKDGSPPAMVANIRPVWATSSAVMLLFGQVDDGTGQPANYSMRFAPTPIGSGWGSATPVTQGTCAQRRSTGGCTVEGLVPGTSYDFQMVAYREDSAGKTVYGPLSPVTTISTTTAPAGAPPAILTLGLYRYNPLASGGIGLVFYEVDDGTGHPASYEIRYAPSPMGTGWGSATSVTKGSCKTPMSGAWTPNPAFGPYRYCTVEGLSPNTAYDFQMVAFRGTLGVDAVFGGLSNVVTAVTGPPPPPPPPGHIQDLSARNPGPDSLTLWFTEVDDGMSHPAKYEIRYARTPMGAGWASATSVSEGSCATPVMGTSIGNRRSCTVKGLYPNTSYDFQMVAFRGVLGIDAVFGGRSNVATGVTAPIPPNVRWQRRQPRLPLQSP
ncbi:MAG: fibronectin type III domain-containing protein [Gemmatimonadetes bacterium]|nr:fibronectin type III domain-containing protein [Gemmatimonadota bacterium]